MDAALAKTDGGVASGWTARHDPTHGGTNSPSAATAWKIFCASSFGKLREIEPLRKLSAEFIQLILDGLKTCGMFLLQRGVARRLMLWEWRKRALVAFLKPEVMALDTTRVAYLGSSSSSQGFA